MIRRIFTLALLGTVAGCAVEEGAPPREPDQEQAEDDGVSVTVDGDQTAASSLNTYVSKVVGEKQGELKGGVIQ